MLAEPADMAVTIPVAETVATTELLEIQEIVLLVAFVGETVAVNCWVEATVIDVEAGLNVTAGDSS